MNEDKNKNALALTTLAIGGIGVLLTTRALVRRARAFDVRGKIVLITGGSRGLGLVLARELASEGAALAITARDDEELERARVDLTSRGAEVFAHVCDVTNKAEVDELVRRVGERFGRIDVLINNAGIIQVGPVETMTLADYERAMQTHFYAPLYAMLAVLPEMRRRRAGRIVNISSIGGKIGVPHLAPYCASKHALVGLSDAFRAELLKDGVVVTTVCPGLMRTGSPRNADFKGQHKLEYAWFAISDSLPVFSINAERAARQIIEAMRRGDAELIITVQAELAAKFRALFPEMTADLLALANKVLPRADGRESIGQSSAKGSESASPLAPSVLTSLSDKAAAQNNEIH
jgi:short-subunit dehydrogenase